MELGEHVGSLTVVVWSSWQYCNRRCLYLDVCQFCEGLWGCCGARHGRTLCLAGSGWETTGGGGGGSACWRAVGGGCDRPECLIFRKFGLSGIHRIARTSDTKVGGWVPPRRIRPPNFGANGPLVGPGQPRTTKKNEKISGYFDFLSGIARTSGTKLEGGPRNPTGGTPTEFRREGATGWAGTAQNV